MSPGGSLGYCEAAPPFGEQIVAFTTGRDDGSFGLGSDEPVQGVMQRWTTLQDRLAAAGVDRLASAHQVHGARVAQHGGAWQGWLRLRDVDGHFTMARGTALAVTIADCTPVFVVHPAGAVAVLHAGWRGTAAGMLAAGLAVFEQHSLLAGECVVHLGPSICGGCYEVGPEVLAAVHGRPASGKGLLDVRAVLVEQAQRQGVRSVTTTESCTRCDNDRFFSHRAGDAGRQLGVIGLR